LNLGEAFNQNGQLQSAIDQFELAGLMLQKIENRKHSDQKTKVELKERLNRIYLSLVDMYLRLDDGSESA